MSEWGGRAVDLEEEEEHVDAEVVERGSSEVGLEHGECDAGGGQCDSSLSRIIDRVLAKSRLRQDVRAAVSVYAVPRGVRRNLYKFTAAVTGIAIARTRFKYRYTCAVVYRDESGLLHGKIRYHTPTALPQGTLLVVEVERRELRPDVSLGITYVDVDVHIWSPDGKIDIRTSGTVRMVYEVVHVDLIYDQDPEDYLRRWPVERRRDVVLKYARERGIELDKLYYTFTIAFQKKKSEDAYLCRHLLLGVYREDVHRLLKPVRKLLELWKKVVVIFLPVRYRDTALYLKIYRKLSKLPYVVKTVIDKVYLCFEAKRCLEELDRLERETGVKIPRFITKLHRDYLSILLGRDVDEVLEKLESSERHVY